MACPRARRAICDKMNKGKKAATVKPFMVKNYLSVFINCMIENPAFDSQVRRHAHPSVELSIPTSTSMHAAGMRCPVIICLATCARAHACSTLHASVAS